MYRYRGGKTKRPIRKFNLVTPELHETFDKPNGHRRILDTIPHESGIIFSGLLGSLEYLRAYQIVNGDEKSYKAYVKAVDYLVKNYPAKAEKAGLYPIMDP